MDFLVCVNLQQEFHHAQCPRSNGTWNWWFPSSESPIIEPISNHFLVIWRREFPILFSFQSVESPLHFLDIFWLQIFVDFCSSVGTGYDRPRQEVSGVWPSKTCRISGAFAWKNSDAVGMETVTPMICVALVGWLFVVRRELVSPSSFWSRESV